LPKKKRRTMERKNEKGDLQTGERKPSFHFPKRGTRKRKYDMGGTGEGGGKKGGGKEYPRKN